MSVERAKRKIQQLERKRSKLVLRCKHLSAEHETIASHCKVVDLLVQHQHNIARALYGYVSSGNDSCFPTLEEDSGLVNASLHQWPLMEQLQHMQLARYAWLHSRHTTMEQVCRTCVEHVQQIALLASYHKNSPDDAQPLLDAAVSDFLHLTKALYLLNPGLAWAMKDVNLITLRQEVPSDGHWQRAFLAADHTLEQLQQLQEVMEYIVPRMQQLESERQQLTDMISMVKGLSLQQQTALQKAAQKEEEQRQAGNKAPEQLPPAAAAAAAGCETRASRMRRHEAAEPASTAQVTTGGPSATQHCSTTATTAAAGQGLAIPFTSGTVTPPPAGSSSSSNGSSSGSDWPGTERPKLCKDMVNELDHIMHKWRMLSGARSAMTYVSTSAQLAAILLHSFPYLPMTSCMCDYIDVAMEKQKQKLLLLQQQQQQQQQQNEGVVEQQQQQQQQQGKQRKTKAKR